MQLMSPETADTPELLAELARRTERYRADVKATLGPYVMLHVHAAMRRCGVEPHVLGLAVGVDFGDELFVYTEELLADQLDGIIASLNNIKAGNGK